MERESNSGESNKNSSASSPGTSSGRGGRGTSRGGGRKTGGRGRGRGGRGKGRSNNKDDAATTATTTQTTTNGDATTTTASPSGTGINGGGRGRGSGGRGKGRGGRGRGGRGRGRGRGGRGRAGGRTNNNNNTENDHALDTDFTSSNPEQDYPMQENTMELQQRTPGRFSSFATTQEDAPMIATTMDPSTPPAPVVLSLPSLPANFAPRSGGGPMILTRNNTVLDDQHISAQVAAASLIDDDEPPPSVATATTTTANVTPPSAAKPEKKKKPRKKKKPHKEPEPPPPVEEPIQEVSTTDALKALPAREVSITSASLIKIRKVDSTGSLTRSDDGNTTTNNNNSTPGKIVPTKTNKKNRRKKGLTGDEAADQRAARHFNREVRTCVERSDPDGVRELLRDKRNHNFALEANVLETVLKAYVMAAMFDDALYCLRNCALPATLTTIQAEHILLCLPQNLRNSSAFTAADMINALCIATEFDVPTKRTYFLRIVRGIALEFLEEATSARDRICSAHCERLVRSALCVVDARLRRGKKATEIVVQPGNQLGVFVPDTMENRGIQAGDAVSILPYAGPYPMSAESLDRNMIEATVTNTNPMVLRLQDKTNSSLHTMLTETTDGNVYRVDKLANRMGFNRQLAAAVAFVSPIEERKGVRDIKRPSATLIKSVTAMDENIERVMNAAGGFKALNGHMTSTAALCSMPVPWNASEEDEEGVDADTLRDASRLALDKYGALEGLNASQRLAVEGACTNRLTLIQGPPGTGKTKVAIRILSQWAKLTASSAASSGQTYPILATSDSNIAVDNLVEGCANVGLSVIRLGRPEAIRPELLRFCIDRPSSGNNSGGGGNAQAFKEKLKMIRNAQVVCCTCIGSGGDILENLIFERVLVDEATQATEPAVLVPLARGCRQLVLVGDHCQLPPTVLSTRAEEEGLGVPLFSRMVACGVPPFMLDTQYRMHPAIAMFPSDLFYGGKLANGVSAPERRPLPGFPWPREEFPVAFVPVYGTEVDDGVSKLNEAEAAAAYDAVEALLKGGKCRISDIAVVTPYAAQARLIRRMLKKLTQHQHQQPVEVSSVDGFQGREKEAVVFSAVRSNDYGAVGFVKDWRRVNVSFTRARRALIVIGNDGTLRRGDPDTWMPWLAWADAHGINMDKPGKPRGRYEPEQLRRVRGGTTAAEMLKDVLERQQAQIKTAEQQLQTAERNAAGHIIGQGLDDDAGDASNNGASAAGVKKMALLEQDLADMATDNWDDDDSEDEGDLTTPSAPAASKLRNARDTEDSGDSGDSDTPLDAWDL